MVPPVNLIKTPSLKKKYMSGGSENPNRPTQSTHCFHKLNSHGQRRTASSATPHSKLVSGHIRGTYGGEEVDDWVTISVDLPCPP
mmetsp:Transcript_20878/g.28384  ORF Transcript_20878/g.28384 Transcript_20878/m.28384 type:complete len:85 (-) Transcript_20878:683-937(-)